MYQKIRNQIIRKLPSYVIVDYRGIMVDDPTRIKFTLNFGINTCRLEHYKILDKNNWEIINKQEVDHCFILTVGCAVQ